MQPISIYFWNSRFKRQVEGKCQLRNQSLKTQIKVLVEYSVNTFSLELASLYCACHLRSTPGNWRIIWASFVCSIAKLILSLRFWYLMLCSTWLCAIFHGMINHFMSIVSRKCILNSPKNPKLEVEVMEYRIPCE